MDPALRRTMAFRIHPYVIIAAIGAAGVVAIMRSDDARSAPTTPTSPASPPLPPLADLAHDDHATALPPNHPPIGAGAMPPSTVSPSDDPASLTWTPPPTWQIVPNPNAMRIATYRVSKNDDTEVTVSRAGGTTDANIERWVRQFDGAGKETRIERAVRGLKITVVEVSGTFLGGGMMPGSASAPRPGWTLVGAVVEGEGSPYFFKMTGATATVHAARAAFDAMLGSLVAAPLTRL